MADQVENDGDLGRGKRCEQPKEPERTEAQLAAIKAAMMEELGACRKDTLPLEDRGYHGEVPTNSTVRRRAPVNAAVAKWQNAKFDDVEEANEQIDSIADGQLYRLRRAAASGPSHTPSVRGGHSSNQITRGGKGGSVIPARGSPDRGGCSASTSNRGGRGDLSLPTRGSSGRARGFAAISRGGIAYLTSSDARQSESTLAVFYNDATRGINTHARVEKTIATLREPSRPTSRLNGTTAPSSKQAYVLSSPDAFQQFMSLKVPSRNTTHAAAPSPEPQQTPPATRPPATADNLGHPQPTSGVTAHSSLAIATPVTGTAISSGSAPAKVNGGYSAIAPAPTPVFNNRSTGIISSKWATTEPVPGPRFSLNASSVSNSIPSVLSISTSNQAPPSQLQGDSTPAAPPSHPDGSLHQPFGSMVKPRSSTINPPAINEAAPPNSTAPAPSTVDVVNTEPVTRIATNNVASYPDQGIIMEKVAKASRNGTEPLLVKARLVKNQDSTISLQIERDGNLIYNEVLRSRLSYEAPSTTLTILDRPNVVTLSFRFPHEAVAFGEHMSSCLQDVSSSTKPNDSNFEPHVAVAESMHAYLIPAAGNSLAVPDKDKAEVIQTDSNAASNKEKIVAIDGNLIDFADDAPRVQHTLSRSGSALDDLAGMKMAGNPVVAEIFGKLNIMADQLSEEAVLSVAENLALEFLQNCNLFNLLPEDHSMSYMKNIGKQVLKLFQEKSLNNNLQQANTAQAINSSQQRIDSLSFHNTGQAVLQQDNAAPMHARLAKSPLQVDCSQPAPVDQQIRKYSVVELMGLRGRGFFDQEKLSKVKELNLDAKVELGSRSSGTSYHQLLQSTPDSMAVSSKVDETTDPALYGTLFSMIVNKPSQFAPTSQISRAKHNPTPSDVDIRLSRKFSGLKLNSPPPVKSPSQPTIQATQIHNPVEASCLTFTGPDPANTHPQPTVQTVKTQVSAQGLRVVKAEADLKASTQAFTPTYSTAQSTADADHTVSNSQANDHKSILSISNKKEDMVKAKIPGLGASKWAANAPAVASTPRTPTLPIILPSSQYAPIQLRTILVPDVYNPGRMQNITGPEVVGNIRILAHQTMSPSRLQENIPFQNMTPFPERPGMVNYRASDASSFFSELKPLASSSSTAPFTTEVPPSTVERKFSEAKEPILGLTRCTKVA